MKKRIFALLLAVAMVLSVCTSFAKKSVFADVTEEDYGWAIDAIEEMAEAKYILGYAEDKTFRPAADVSILHSMIFGARAAGFVFDENKKVIEVANALYEPILEDYDFDYKSEASFLLYKGVLQESDLDYYFAEENLNKPMPRYKIAELLTKVCMPVELPKVKLSYDDVDEIPEGYDVYVQYVTDRGLMTGVGDNKFSPTTTVTRAQMAVMLYRVINLLEMEVITGTIATLIPDSSRIYIQTEDGTEKLVLTESTVICANTEKAELSDLYTGYMASVTFFGDNIVRVDAVLPYVQEIVEGTVASVSTSGTGSVKVITEKGTFTHSVKNDCAIKLDGEAATLADISSGDEVTLWIAEGGLAIQMEAIARDQVVAGNVSKIAIEGDALLVSIKDAEGNTSVYTVGNDSEISVTRNGKVAAIGDLMVGDKVSAIVRQDLLFSIDATSVVSTVSGQIKEIVMSDFPSITIAIDKETMETYPIYYTTEYTINGSPAEIYDLRLGTYVKLKLDSQTVTKVEVTNANEGATSTTSTLTGIVSDVNTSYSVIVLTVTDPTSGITADQQIFVKSATLIDGSTGGSIKLSKIEKGAAVTAIGSVSSGIFIAKTVMVVH